MVGGLNIEGTESKRVFIRIKGPTMSFNEQNRPYYYSL